MAQNLISASLSATEAAEVEQNLNAVKAGLKFLLSLQTDDTKGLFKVGPNFLPFVEEAFQTVKTHPEILPGVFDKEEFLKDYALLSALSPILNQINELAEGVKKTFTAVGSDALMASLEVYATVRQNKDKVPGLSVTADRMADYFKKTKAEPKAKAEVASK